MTPGQPCPSPFSSLSTQGWAGLGGIPLLGARTSWLGPWVLRGVKRSRLCFGHFPVGLTPPLGLSLFGGAEHWLSGQTLF